MNIFLWRGGCIVMFIFSVKTSKKKVLLILIFILILVIIGFILFGKKEDKTTAVCSWGEYNITAENNEQIIDFLKQFGWEVEPTPVSCDDIIIPSVFDDTYTSYNEIQKNQGLDLSEYMGKNCKKYIFKITNYPNVKCDMLATVIIYNGKVIGGDISEAVYEGLMTGFI